MLIKNIGRNSRDYLAFRIALAEELVGSFRGRRHIGRPRSLESQRLERLDTSLGHWPVVVQEKRVCVVCSKVREKRGLTRNQYRHESRVTCSVCKVHLCVTSERDCFKKYHTLDNYWS